MKVIKAIVGTVFPANDQKSPDIARLMIAANVIRSLQRAFLRVNSDDYGQEVGPQVAAGDRLVVYLLTIGALKEAMDAFRTLDRWFGQWLDKHAKDTYERFSKACQESDDSSLYKRIEPIRHNVAFHWASRSGKLIQKVIRALGSHKTLEVFVSYTGKFLDSRYCLADDILVNMASAGKTVEGIKDEMKQIVDACGAFCELVDICVGSYLKGKGAVLEERG